MCIHWMSHGVQDVDAQIRVLTLAVRFITQIALTEWGARVWVMF